MYPPRCRTNSCSGAKASRRTPECSPSAPTTMSNRRTVPPANVTLRPSPSSVSPVIWSPNRYSVPSRVASYRMRVRLPRMISISATIPSPSSRPAPRRSTACPPGRGAGATSTTVGAKPCRRSQNASAGPPMPAPEISTVRLSIAVPPRCVRCIKLCVHRICTSQAAWCTSTGREQRSMTQPPYRRIADEIRARIADRELRPGDQVPSARGITREWGVALATATKVLATLNAEGVTRALPGRGTVVASPAGPAQPAGVPARARRDEGDPDLTRERIVAAAIRVADAEGLAQLSMRRIATELRAAPMSLYRHVNGKDELLVSMMDSVLGEDPLPARPPSGWRAQLELSSRMQWQGFRRHPWLAQALSITRPQLIPNGMRHTEWALRALDGLGLTIQEMMHIHMTLF